MPKARKDQRIHFLVDEPMRETLEALARYLPGGRATMGRVIRVAIESYIETHQSEVREALRRYRGKGSPRG